MGKLNLRITGKFYRKWLFGMLSVLICSGAFGQKKITPEDARKDRARNIVLPESEADYKAVKSYIEETPDADYIHASEKAHEAFRDIKYSIRIHWGFYSIWGIEASGQMRPDGYKGIRMNRQQKQEYINLYKTFNPTDFNADEWMDLFKRFGNKIIMDCSERI